MTGRGSGADLYALLGVSPDVDSAQLASAYRRRLREVHPDTRTPYPAPDPGPGGRGRGVPGGGMVDDASTTLRALQEAYLTLRDPVRRARYDAQRRRDETGASTGAAEVGSRADPGHGKLRASDGAVPIRVRVHPRSARERHEWIRVGPVHVDPNLSAGCRPHRSL